jgi:hypothetical protein
MAFDTVDNLINNRSCSWRLIHGEKEEFISIILYHTLFIYSEVYEPPGHSMPQAIPEVEEHALEGNALW